MKSSEILSIICNLEKSVDVNAWRIDDVCVWPYVREQIYINAYKSENFTVAKGRPGVNWRVVLVWVQKLGDLCRLLSKLSSSILIRRKKSASAVIVSNGATFLNIQGKAVDKICDPIISGLEEKDVKCDLLLSSSLFRRKAAGRGLPLRSGMDVSVLLGRIRSLIWKGAESSDSQEIYRSLVNECRKTGFDVYLPGLKDVRKSMQSIQSIAMFYQFLFFLMRPSMAFVVCYYSYDGMALALACRRLKIPLVDVQHGVQGVHHRAYGRLDVVPVNGYALMPKYFWCWGEYEVSVIDQWAKNTHYHEAFRGGDLWLKYWQDRFSSEKEDYDEQLMEIVRRDGSHYKGEVLLTLQPGLENSKEIRNIIDYINTGSEYFWWIRIHPTMMGKGHEINAMLTNEKGFNVDAASRMPLLNLISRVDVHLTHSSSVVLEAKRFGVCTIIVSEDAQEFYEQEIVEGYVSFLENSDVDRLITQVSEKDLSLDNCVPDQGISFVQSIIQGCTCE
jgi:hypothetical protein